ncbi:OLC1v1030193C1 [Oldenlandia corymbosa var. corymbosa]|uniref:OLC1v1030193C1 n=1 Tax=Oldenlandia corymbosa var. corymbosa TaxID=529605 RepID=A0AAV1CIK2_OLDCO|nr:OLC1v1030193C1 [Oldenlandia corymbosa var. corymbosa]
MISAVPAVQFRCLCSQKKEVAVEMNVNFTACRKGRSPRGYQSLRRRADFGISPEDPFVVERPFITKAVLSANPSHTSDFALMVIHSGDVNYYNGKFYAVDCAYQVRVWDELASDLKFAQPLLSLDERLLMGGVPFLVVSSLGELLVLGRQDFTYEDVEEDSFPIKDLCTAFAVVRLDVMNRNWEEISRLDNDAIFVGRSPAVSIAGFCLPRLVRREFTILKMQALFKDIGDLLGNFYCLWY